MSTEPEVPANTEGGNAAMAVTGTSVRAVVLGKGDSIIEREVDRSAVHYIPVRHDVGTPGHSDQMEDEAGIEDGPAQASDLRFSFVERTPLAKRGVEDEDDAMWGAPQTSARRWG